MVQCKRGEIYYADLSPTIGSEQGGVRPIMIIQNNTGNRYAPTVIIAPITSRLSSKVKLPTHVRLGQIPWLDRDSIVLLEQIRTIDKSRLEECKGYIEDMKSIDRAIKISLGLKKQDKQKREEMSNVQISLKKRFCTFVLLGLVRYFIGTQSFSFEKEVRHGRDKANGCKGLLCRRCSEDTWSWTKQCLPLFR